MHSASVPVSLSACGAMSITSQLHDLEMSKNMLPGWFFTIRAPIVAARGTIAWGLTKLLHGIHSVLAFVIPSYRIHPPRPGDTMIGKEWMERVLACPVESVEVGELKGNRGLAGVIQKVTVKGEKQLDLILKTSQPSRQSRASFISQGSRREADFYHSNLSTLPPLDDIVPKCHYNYSSPLGECVMLLEDINADGKAIPVNFVFGNQIWGGIPPDLQLPGRQETLIHLFQTTAKFHVSHWRDATLFGNEYNFLRGWDWYRGSGRAAWETSVRKAQRAWNAFKSRKPATLTPELESLMDKSLDNASWNTYQKRLGSTSWTFCHNDFHSSNMYLRDGEFKWFDWSECGIHPPMYDLAQLVISDVDIDALPNGSESLKEAVNAYYDTWLEEMTKVGKTDETFTREEAWLQFVRGGMAKWTWMTGLLAGFPLPDAAMSYFIKQLTTFAKLGADVPVGQGRLGCHEDATQDGWELGPVVLIS